MVLLATIFLCDEPTAITNDNDRLACFLGPTFSVSPPGCLPRDGRNTPPPSDVPNVAAMVGCSDRALIVTLRKLLAAATDEISRRHLAGSGASDWVFRHSNRFVHSPKALARETSNAAPPVGESRCEFSTESMLSATAVPLQKPIRRLTVGILENAQTMHGQHIDNVLTNGCGDVGKAGRRNLGDVARACRVA